MIGRKIAILSIFFLTTSIVTNTSASADRVYIDTHLFESPYKWLRFGNNQILRGEVITVEWRSNWTVTARVISVHPALPGSTPGASAGPDEIGRITVSFDRQTSGSIEIFITDYDYPGNRHTVFLEYAYNWNGSASLPTRETSSDQSDSPFPGVNFLNIIIIISIIKLRFSKNQCSTDRCQ